MLFDRNISFHVSLFFIQVFNSAKHVICNSMQNIFEEILLIRSTGMKYSRTNHTKSLKACLRNPLILTFMMLYMFRLNTNWRKLCNDKKKIILKGFLIPKDFFSTGCTTVLNFNIYSYQNCTILLTIYNFLAKIYTCIQQRVILFISKLHMYSKIKPEPFHPHPETTRIKISNDPALLQNWKS